MRPAAPRSIYVEIDIRAPVDDVWRLTQTPELHQHWDLRFTEIRYLPRPDPGEPQRFHYATRIGFGLAIRGEGETVGSHAAATGQRSSALKFWSKDPKSLIRAGSGYWRYSPTADGTSVQFATGYDYEVRFGLPGRVFDRFVFRPLMGWATAWSFDRLRLWIERGISPATAIRRSLAYGAARFAVALVWTYQGAVPKLIFRDHDELALLRAGGLAPAAAHAARLSLGWVEVAMGAILLFAWRARWPLWLTLVLMPIALLGVAMRAPSYLTAAFNPVALNVALFALAGVALVEDASALPSARRCARRPGGPRRTS